MDMSRPRILVVARNDNLNLVFNPLLHLYDMVALPTSSLSDAKDIVRSGHVDGVILHTSFCREMPAIEFLSWLRSCPLHAATRCAVLNGDHDADDDLVAAACVLGACLFKYPRELTSILDYFEEATTHRNAA